MFFKSDDDEKVDFPSDLVNDKNKACEFEDTFGQSYIRKDPPGRSSSLILLFEFSLVKTADHLRKGFQVG
jgi:hypothetical protein